jgi:DNA uptake protein ComE-like DNA-binding protein
MTEEIADSILDWIDEDDDPRPFGAEAQYYSYDGYEPRNGPIASLDELLMVNGVTPELLFGADRNHNGLVDASEQDLASAMQTGISSMSRGWSAFLTVRSMDAPLQNEPIDLNQEDLEALYDEILTVEGMSQDIATYIVAYRQSGPYTPPEPSQEEEDGGNPDDNQEPPEPEQINGRTVDLTQEGSNTISSMLDLVGSMTQAKFDEDQTTIVESPFGTDPSELSSILPDLMANFTTGDEAVAGRINLNQCNQVTLSSVPGMSEELVQSILGQQDPSGMSTDPNVQYPTWPLAFGLTTVDEMKGLLPLLSTTGRVFAAQIVATSDLPGGFARAEVVIDASDGTPQVVSWRDLTHLGPGFTTPSN